MKSNTQIFIASLAAVGVALYLFRNKLLPQKSTSGVMPQTSSAPKSTSNPNISSGKIGDSHINSELGKLVGEGRVGASSEEEKVIINEVVSKWPIGQKAYEGLKIKTSIGCFEWVLRVCRGCGARQLSINNKNNPKDIIYGSWVKTIC